jgi:hypothetical protein
MKKLFVGVFSTIKLFGGNGAIKNDVIFICQLLITQGL